MRLGIVGFFPNDLDAIDDRAAARITSLGFSGIGIHLTTDREPFSPAAFQNARSVFANHGIRVVQAWTVPQVIVSPGDSNSDEAVRQLQNTVTFAADLGADMAGIRPGSMNPAGAWTPHPANHSPEVEDAIVDILREAVSACEVHGIPFAFETHVISPLDSPERIKRIIERTESPWVKLSLDPVNFVSDVQKLYDTTSLLNHLFDTLGPHIIAAHINDVYVEDRLTVHISGTVPGDGLLDFGTFFRRFEALLPDGFGLIEHLPASLVPQASTFVKRKLAELDIEIRSG